METQTVDRPHRPRVRGFSSPIDPGGAAVPGFFSRPFDVYRVMVRRLVRAALRHAAHQRREGLKSSPHYSCGQAYGLAHLAAIVGVLSPQEYRRLDLRITRVKTARMTRTNYTQQGTAMTATSFEGLTRASSRQPERLDQSHAGDGPRSPGADSGAGVSPPEFGNSCECGECVGYEHEPQPAEPGEGYSPHTIVRDV